MEENDVMERGRWCTEVSQYSYSINLTSLELVIACYEVSMPNHTSGIVPDRTMCNVGVPKWVVASTIYNKIARTDNLKGKPVGRG